jgi:hypothetical protein
MPDPAPRPRPRYRVICYELIDGHEEVIADITDQGFVLATRKLAGEMIEGELNHAGPRDLQAHLALLIANDKQLLGEHTHAKPRRR